MTDNKVPKLKQIKYLIQAARLFSQKAVHQETSMTYWLDAVRQCHHLGYLFLGFDKNDNVGMAAIAYRVPEVNEHYAMNIPEKEFGNTVFVSGAASKGKENLGLLRLLRWYLRKNPDVDSVAYGFRNNHKDMRIHKVLTKEPSYGKQEEA